MSVDDGGISVPGSLRVWVREDEEMGLSFRPFLKFLAKRCDPGICLSFDSGSPTEQILECVFF